VSARAAAVAVHHRRVNTGPPGWDGFVRITSVPGSTCVKVSRHPFTLP
jgi:hypothetical protein